MTRHDSIAIQSPALAIGTIVAFVNNNPPAGWLLCDGSEISSAYTQLSQMCNGKTPDLRGRMLVMSGSTTDAQGKPVSFAINDQGGNGTHTLVESEMPRHCHTFHYSDASGGGTQPNSIAWNEKWAKPGTDYSSYVGGDPKTGDVAGPGVPFSLLPPYFALNFIIYAGPAGQNS